VQRAVAQRSEAYCFALQRLVIATPAPMAAEVERSLILFNTLIAENHAIAGPHFGPATVSCGPQVVAAAAAPMAPK